MGACSKHYLGYGGGGDADEKELLEEILMPHETMIRLAGSKALMPGYHAVHGINCVANDEILNDILRGYLGFDGMVVSDYTAIDQLPDQKDPLHKAAAAINGGNDVDFPQGDNYKFLQQAIDQGLVKPEAFERAVKDVLRYLPSQWYCSKITASCPSSVKPPSSTPKPQMSRFFSLVPMPIRCGPCVATIRSLL